MNPEADFTGTAVASDSTKVTPGSTLYIREKAVTGGSSTRVSIPARPTAPSISGSYAVSTTDSTKFIYTVNSPAFTGLKSAKENSFAARYAETDNYFASPAGDSIEVKTNNVPVSAYPPAVEQPEGGSVDVSNKNPEKGDKVTVTPKPDEGYEVGSVTVTDKNGNPVEVTDNGDGTYTVKQPSGKVTVTVTFKEKTQLVFVDVPADAYYADAVLWAVKEDITNGTSSTTFSPDATCTRAQIVSFLYRCLADE